MKKLMIVISALIVTLLVSSNASASLHTASAYNSAVKCYSATYHANVVYASIIERGGKHADVAYFTKFFDINNAEEWNTYIAWVTKLAPKWWLELNEISLMLAKDNDVFSRETFVRLVVIACLDEYWSN